MRSGCREDRDEEEEENKDGNKDKNKGIGDAGSTADLRMLWSAIVCLSLL